MLQCIAVDEALLLLLALECAAGGVLQYVLAINSFKEKFSKLTDGCDKFFVNFSLMHS